MIVVDASVIIATLMADGRTRQALLRTPTRLVAPPLIREEIERNMPRIVQRAGSDAQAIRRVLDEVWMHVDVIPPRLYAHARADAQEACRRAEAWGDDEYVALAMALEVPVWTLDQDFERVAGIQTVRSIG